MKRGDEIELTIESLAFGGAGIGRFVEDEKSLVVFVEDTVPGDQVKVRIGSKKRKYAYGYIVDFLHKAPNRIEPRCRHFGVWNKKNTDKQACGGCSLQYLSYSDQLAIKEQHVKDAIVRIGGFEQQLVLPIIGCKDPWFYRNKMEFSFSRVISAKNVGSSGKIDPTNSQTGELSLGLHVRRMHYDVIELTECFLLGAYSGDLVKTVRDFFRKLDAGKKISVEMRLVSLVVREGKQSGEIMINLIAENGEADFLEDFVQMVVQFFEHIKSEQNAVPSKKLASIYFTHVKNKKGTPKSLTEKLLWGNPVIHEYLNVPDGSPLQFEISPQAFFQPNTQQAEILYSKALEAAKLTGKEIIFDLYCGAGTIGIFCARSAGKVYGIEVNESAIKNARANAQLNKLTNTEFLVGDVLKNLPELKAKPGVIIVDPPRAGLDPKVVEKTLEFAPARIVYVSCNPTTLARDLQLYTKTGYKLISVQPVDMFPQTYHIECVALLERL